MSVPTVSEQNILAFIEQLSEADAVPFNNMELLGVPLLGDLDIVRGWEEIEIDDVPTLMYCLELYTSAKNAEANTPLKYVDDPMINSEVFSGRFRAASLHRRTTGNGDLSTIVQVLRRGYITSLVTASVLDWSEARLENGKDLPAGTNATNPGGTTTENYVLVKWPNVSPDHVRTIVASINALAPASFNPTIRSQSYGTGFHRIYTTHEIEDDGSATIILLLASPEYRLTGFRSWFGGDQEEITYLWNVPKELAQAVIDAGKGVGKSIIPSYSSQSGLVDLVIYSRELLGRSLLGVLTESNCDSYTMSSFYMGTYYPALYVIPQSTDPGFSYRKRIGDNKDGTYDIVIDVTVRNQRDYAAQLIRKSGTEQILELVKKGVIDNANIPVITSPGQGQIYDMDINIRDDCSKDVTLRLIESITNAFHFHSGHTWLQQQYEYGYSAYRQAVEVPAERDQGWVFDSVNRMNPDQTYDGQLRMNQEVARDFSVAWNTKGGTAQLYVFENQPIFPSTVINALSLTTSNGVDASFTPGGNYNVRVSKTPVRSGGSNTMWDNETIWWTYRSDADKVTEDMLVYVYFTTNMSNANTFMQTFQSVTPASSDISERGSQINHAGQGRLMCTKIMQLTV